MGLFDKVFPTSKSIAKATDAVIKGIDESVLTREEKIDHLNDWLKSSLPHNQTMRVFAWSIGGAWIGSYTAIFILTALGQPAADLERLMNEYVNPHLDTILMCYFGVAGLTRIGKSK